MKAKATALASAIRWFAMRNVNPAFLSRRLVANMSGSATVVTDIGITIASMTTDAQTAILPIAVSTTTSALFAEQGMKTAAGKSAIAEGRFVMRR